PNSVRPENVVGRGEDVISHQTLCATVSLQVAADELRHQVFHDRSLCDRGVLRSPAGEGLAKDSSHVVFTNLIPPVDEERLVRLAIWLDGLLKCLEQGPCVFEMPIQDRELSKSLAHPVFGKSSHNLFQRAAAQADRAGKVSPASRP